MNDAPERKYRTQVQRWFVEICSVDGGGIGRWEETTKSVEVPNKEAAEALQAEWLASGKLYVAQWGEVRPSKMHYGDFRIRQTWEDVPAALEPSPDVAALVEAAEDALMFLEHDGGDSAVPEWKKLRAALAAYKGEKG